MKYRDCYEWTRTEQGKYIRYASKSEIISLFVMILIPALLLGWLIPQMDNIVTFVLLKIMIALIAVIGLLCNCILFGIYLRERVVFDE